jgi:macrodomain Ter protein organizer (MatP/YcbG family)
MTDLKRKSIFLPFRLWDLLSKEAKVYGITVSQLMEKVVNDYFRLPNNDQ